MNFLSEVLSAAEKSEIESIRKKIPELSTDITNLKNETWNFINNVYIKFNERPQINSILSKNVQRCSAEIDSLQSVIEQLIKKDVPDLKNNMSSIEDELEETKIILKSISKFVNIHHRLVKIRNCFKNKLLVESVEGIQLARKEIKDLETDEEVKEATKKMLIDLHYEETFIKETISEIINKSITIDNKILNSNVARNVLKIDTDHTHFTEAFEALYLLDNEMILISRITTFIFDHILLPILKNSTRIEIINDEKCKEIVIYVDLKKEPLGYKNIFNNLTDALELLRSSFNFPLNKEITALKFFTQRIKKSFEESLIKFCLLKTIPSDEEELKDYEVIYNDISNFEKELYKYLLLDEEETIFTDYVKNIDVLYIENKCQIYTEKSVLLMKKDLHEMIEVGATDSDKLFVENSSKFPKCFVSKSVIELLKLIESMLQKAADSPQVNAIRIINAAENIFNMYESVVYENHEKMLNTIPQQIALFKNNCWYLSYEINVLNESFKEKLTFLNETTPLFKNQSHQLRVLGAEMFQNYIVGQVSLMNEILQNSELGDLQTLENLDNNIEKAIRQCLRQQELLKTVWHKILPYNDYNETIGYIFNSFCCKLITFVLSVEDIGSEIAEQLVDTFKIVQTRGPKLFSEPKEINMYVEVWYKFNEIVFILSGSLVDIDDRWAEGKGPLALVLKPEELKRLVRALFQNTDRRAAFLAKII